MISTRPPWLPYTNDLVRLAASALLAISEGHLSLKAKDACAVIVDAYRKSLAEGGSPFVLEEEHGWLRQIALSELRNPVLFLAEDGEPASIQGGDSGQCA